MFAGIYVNLIQVFGDGVLSPLKVNDASLLSGE